MDNSIKNFYKIKEPCSKCPFLKSSPKGWLGSERMKGIIDSMVVQEVPFICHQTIGEEEGDEFSGKQSACNGAFTLLHKKGDLYRPMVNRISSRESKNSLEALYQDPDNKVFDYYIDAIKHHNNEED